MKIYCVLMLFFTYPVFGFSQKWDKYIYVSPGISKVSPPQNNFYNTSVSGTNLFPALGFSVDYNSSAQITWVTGLDVSYVKASVFAQAYDGFYTNFPPYILLSNYSSGFVNVPLYLRIKTQRRDRNFGYLIAGGGLSYSPFGVYRNFLEYRSNDSSPYEEFLEKGVYVLNDEKKLPISAYLTIGIGANFTIADRPFSVELSYSSDITKWEYQFYNPYFERNESETFVRKMVQLKLGMRMFK